MGFFCAHHYAHTIEAQSKRLPYALKGSDAIFYSVFRHLGCAIDVRPVIDYDHENEEREEAHLRKWRKLPDPEKMDLKGGNPPGRVGVGLPVLQVSELVHGERHTYKEVISTVRHLRREPFKN